MVASPRAFACLRFGFSLACVLTALMMTDTASALTLTFDTDGNSANGITETSGSVWNTTDARWFSSTEIANVAWPNTTADTAIFGAGGGTSSSTVLTVGTSGNLNVNKIIFNYPAANGSYQLNSGGHLMFGGTTPTVTVNSNTAQIQTRMTAPSFIKDGSGTLIINNSLNNLGALTINAGMLDIFSALTTTDVVVAAVSGARFDTHSGTTWTMDSLTYSSTSNSNMLSLGNGSASNYTIGAGGLTMNAGTITVTAGTTTTSNAKSTLTVNGPLNLNGGTISMATSTTAGNEAAESKLVLKGNVNVNATTTINNAGLGKETVDLDAGNRTVTVATGFTFNLNAVTANGGIIKEGAGTLKFGGAEANTYTGMTTLNAGVLQIGKTAGINSILGDITVNGGTLDWDTANQIADTASIFLNGGTLKFEGFTETFANLTIAGGNPNDGGGSNGGFVTLTGTLFGVSGNSGLSLNSGGQWTVNAVNFVAAFNPSGSEIGLNGNSPRLTLFTVGAGGLTINGQAFAIEKAPTANPTNAGSEMAIYGDVTATGSNNFSFGTSNTSGVSQVNLGSGTRTWNIISGTTTINSNVVSLSPGDGASTPTRTVVEGGINKTGAGLLILAASNSYTGKTTVAQGTLRLGTNSTFGTGSLTDSAWLQVDSGATFENSTGAVTSFDGIISGTGTFTGAGGYRVTSNIGAVNGNGVIRPGGSSNPALASTAGDQTGILTFTGPLELAAGTATVRAQLQIISATGNAASSYTVNMATWLAGLSSNHAALLTGNTTGNHDQIRLTGSSAAGTLTLNSGGIIEVVAPNGYVPSFGDIFNLMDWAALSNNGFNVGTNNRTGGLGGGDLSLPDLSAYNGYTWDVSQFLTSGIVIVVPEPGRAMLLSLGLIGLLMRRRRK